MQWTPTRGPRSGRSGSQQGSSTGRRGQSIGRTSFLKGEPLTRRRLGEVDLSKMLAEFA